MTTMLPHDSSPDEHDSEQPPSKTSKGNEQAPAAKQKGPNCTGEWKEYNWWSRPDHSDSDPEITSFIRADLAELNKSDGITSLPPRHYDRKRGNIYGDWMYRNSWSTHKDAIINTTLLCGRPCEAEIVEMPGQFIPTFMRNLRQPITQLTTPSFSHATSKI